MLPLILYDIPSTVEGGCWSPNLAKPRQVNSWFQIMPPSLTSCRYVLRYKGLPFEVEWVELPDIAPRMKDIGATPGRGFDGVEKYTLPVLHDPNSGAIITDSWEIAIYLDHTYPEKRVFPKGTEGLIGAFATVYPEQFRPAIKILLMRSMEVLNERSREYYLAAREEQFNQKMEDWSPEGPERDRHWSVIEKAFTTMKIWFDKSEGKWLMGNTFSYADILAATHLFWFKKVLHVDEWKKIAAWHDGQWERLLADVERECKVV